VGRDNTVVLGKTVLQSPKQPVARQHNLSVRRHPDSRTPLPGTT
jgi:hypothetical protein